VLAPYGEGQLEAHGEDAFGDFVGARAEGVRGRVEGGRVGGVGRVVPPHVEALHGGKKAKGGARRAWAVRFGGWWSLACESRNVAELAAGVPEACRALHQLSLT